MGRRKYEKGMAGGGLKNGMGKRKGGQFERDICRKISLFWSDNKYNDLCWRAAGSGNKGTVTKTTNKNYWGDLVGTSPTIESLFDIFCFELKFYKEIDISEILRGLTNVKILTFWKQCVIAARKSHRIPVLIARKNFLGTLLILLKDDAFLFLPTMNKPIKFMTLGNKLIIFNLDDFLKNVNRERFVKTINIMHQEKHAATA